MRSPRRSCARCLAVYVVGDPFEDVATLCDGLLLSVLLIPLLRVGLGGIAGWLSAVDAGYLASGPYTSLGTWENERYPSQRVFIDVVATVGPLMRQPMTLRLVGPDVRG